MHTPQCASCSNNFIHCHQFELPLLAYYLLSLQVRYPVLLTPTEKQMAREVCVAFRQAVSQNETSNVPFTLKCHLFVSIWISYYCKLTENSYSKLSALLRPPFLPHFFKTFELFGQAINEDVAVCLSNLH